jgi:TolA-binding protein
MRALLFAVLSFFASAQDSADDQYQYVVGLAEKGLHDRVIKEAESFLAEHPGHAKADHARYRLAAALFELKREDDALPHLRALAAHRGFELESEVLFRLGQCELSAERFDAATGAFERVLSLGKDYLREPATWMLGEARFRAKDYAAAQKQYAAVLSAAPRGTYADDAACGLAWCAYRLGKPADALDRIESALERVGDGERQSEMAFLAGECLLDLGQPEGALDAYRAVESGPFADAALRGAGFARAAKGDHAGAAKDFRALLERFPKSRFAPECALHAGIESLSAGDAKAALAALSSPLVEKSDEALYWRARAQSESGDAKAALQTLDQVKSREGELAQRAGVLRGECLAKLGDSKGALAAYERSGSDYALQRAAVESLGAGRASDAERLAKKLLADFPKSQYAPEARMVVGEARFAQKDYVGAEESFRSAAEAEQDKAKSVAARGRIAWCRYLRGEHAEAAAMFAEIAKRGGDSPEAIDARWMHGRSLEAAGDKAGAQAAYQRFLERHGEHEKSAEATLRLARLDPSADSTARLEELASGRTKNDALAAEACHELAERASAAGDFAKARARYTEALRRDAASPLVPAARYGIAWCLYNERSYPEASETLRTLLASKELDPKLREASAELAVWTACKVGDANAIASAWKAFAETTGDETKLVRAARTTIAALKSAGDVERARTLVTQLAKSARDPKLSATLSIESAYLHLDAGDIDAAERELERARRALPDDPALAEAYFFTGEARFEKGDAKKAGADYAVAIQNASCPVRDRALYKMGFAALRSDAFEDAQRCFATLVEEHAKSELFHESLFLLGETLYRRGNYEEAAVALKRVLKEAPRHAVRPKALFRLGLAYGELERWKESADALSALARETPDFENAAEAELYRGRALAALGDARSARTAFDRVIALDRGVLSGRAHLEIGKIYQRGNNLDQALSEYLKVAVLYADASAVGEALLLAGEVLEAQGDVERARSQYRELIEKHPKTQFAATARERMRTIGSK